jgi:uncharacterized protein (UPF0248 family)
MRVRDLLIALLVILICCFAITAFAGPIGERIMNVPQDQNKWYVSVVGETGNTQYKEILSWFDSGELKNFKDQVFFIPVTTQNPIYADRYEKNTKTLPMVRVQDAEGIRIYEVQGTEIPATARALTLEIGRHAAEYTAAKQAQDAKDSKQRNRKPDPKPTPDKVKIPVAPDPDPQPLSNIGIPKIDLPPWYMFPGVEDEQIKTIAIVGILALLVLLPWRKKVC